MRFRITTRRMMVLIGLLGVGSALLRVHPALAALAVGVWTLAFIRTCEKIDQAREAGRSIGARRSIGIGLASGCLAMALMAAGLVPLCCILPILNPHDLAEDLVQGIVLTSVLGTPIIALLKRKLW